MFRPPSLLVPQVVPTAAYVPQGSRDFYIRAERASLPLHAPDMLAVRIQVIDGARTFTLQDPQPCRLLPFHVLRKPDICTCYEHPAILSQPTCPWLTAGSAARALGGDVSVSISTTNNNDGSCKFLKLQDSRDSLQIQVGKGSLTGCPGEHTNLVGIGNEAAECRLPGSHGETVEW